MIRRSTEDRRASSGLRVYPNPKFDAAARKRWDANRYYSDPNYYNDPKLVRPYVVGMACGFCHVSFNPLKPPDDPEKPKWENLSSTIGNQYFNSSRIFGNGATADSYAYQLFHSWPRGTVDTSFLATDNLNNPSKMNPIFAIPARLTVAHEEEITGGALNFPGEQSRMAVPHVLKDGADSVGIIGALSRVYVSIGEFSQQWLRDHNVIVGGKPQRPFSVCQCAEELSLLSGDRRAHSEPGEISDEDERSASRRCAREEKRSSRRMKRLLQRGKTRLRRKLRQVPLQQAAACGFGQNAAAISRLDARRGSEARLPREQFPVHRGAHSR